MPESEPHPLFKALDTNNDGKLSLEELPELLRPAFERMDTDGDGFITPAEEAAARGAAAHIAIEATPLQRFTTRLSVRGDSVAVPIPFDPNDIWGAKERHDVSGTVNGHRVRGPLKPDREGYVFPLGPAWRRDAALDTTQPVEAEFSPESPLVEELADDLQAALIARPEAHAFFESIAPFYRKNYIRWVEAAKRPETRTARIAEAVLLLEEKKRQR